jgi:hypothetical protein
MIRKMNLTKAKQMQKNQPKVRTRIKKSTQMTRRTIIKIQKQRVKKDKQNSKCHHILQRRMSAAL